MTAHAARAVRETGPGGVGRGFSVRCPICRHYEKAASREDAETKAAQHNAPSDVLGAVAATLEIVRRIRCECYDLATLEYAPSPCDRCRAVEILEAAAVA